MTAAWLWWVQLWDRQESPRVLAAVRVLLGLVLLTDYLEIARLGLVDALFCPPDQGGIPDVARRTPAASLWPALQAVLPDGVPAGRVIWAVLLVCSGLIALGAATPLAMVTFVLVSAQHGWAAPLADRGIDTLIRNVLVILAFSGSHRAWSVDAALGAGRDRVASWPRHLIILQVCLMYFMAGVLKTAVSWSIVGGYSALYLVLQDPTIARHDFSWLDRLYPATQVATAATVSFEWTAALVPLAYWFRDTRGRRGWLRAQSNRFRWVLVWAIVGVALHVGIAATMALGIFPWAMLALYPCFLHPDEWIRARQPRSRTPAQS